jgi:glycosyltransferase 2 family protein
MSGRQPATAHAEPRSRALRSLTFWLAVVVTAAGLAFALRGFDGAEFAAALTRARPGWILASVGLLAVALVIRALRWWVLFDPSTRPSLVATTVALTIGNFYNCVLPARGGELARIVVIHRRAGASRAEAVSTVMIERVFDVLGLGALLFLLLPWLPALSWARAAALVCLGLLVGTVVAAGVLHRFHAPLLTTLGRLLRSLPYVGAVRAEHAAANLMRGMRRLASPGAVAAALSLTLLSWLVLGLSFWLVLLAFDPGLSPLAGMLVVIAVGFGMVLPSSPAALGVFEAAAIVALGAYGVPRAAALSYALVLHAVNFFPYVLAGIPLVRFAARRPPPRSEEFEWSA